jgi:hypothetical protein
MLLGIVGEWAFLHLMLALLVLLVALPWMADLLLADLLLLRVPLHSHQQSLVLQTYRAPKFGNKERGFELPQPGV